MYQSHMSSDMFHHTQHQKRSSTRYHMPWFRKSGIRGSGGHPVGAEGHVTMSIILDIKRRVQRGITTYIQRKIVKNIRKKAFRPSIQTPWWGRPKNQYLLAHLEPKPDLIAKTRVKSIQWFLRYSVH